MRVLLRPLPFLSLLGFVLASCSKTTAPTSPTTPPTDTTKQTVMCPYGSAMFTMRDTTRTGCAVDRFNVQGSLNASWLGVDTIPFLGSTTERAWTLILHCPATVGAHPIDNITSNGATLSIAVGLGTSRADDGLVNITECSSTKVSGSFTINTGGIPVTGTFSFIPS